jgi:hypothetical protein
MKKLVHTLLSNAHYQIYLHDWVLKGVIYVSLAFVNS